MSPSMLILAVAMGNRYGGLKQIEPIGTDGQTIMDYSVYDAMRAGFGKLICVIRRDIEEPFGEVVGHKFEDKIEVEYVFQELGYTAPWFRVRPQRWKAWGTGHAILMDRDVIHGPFGVINGDDLGQNRPCMAQDIRRLVARGEYPERLWS